MSKIYMKKYKKLSLFLIMILSLVNILISCNKKSEVIETTTGEQTTSTTVTKPIQNLACTIQLWRSSEVISADDYAKIDTKMTEKYGLKSSTIFR